MRTFETNDRAGLGRQWHPAVAIGPAASVCTCSLFLPITVYANRD